MPKSGSMRESDKTVNAKSKQGIAADIDRTMKTSQANGTGTSVSRKISPAETLEKMELKSVR